MAGPRIDGVGPELQDQDYLGDGVYVGHDGYHVVLWVDGSAYGPGAIALEPPVLEALVRYVRRIKNDPEALAR